MRKGRFTSAMKDSEVFLSLVILLIAFGFGTLVRIQFVSDIDYPINDGGLFYQMVEDLLDNNLRIPAYTTYNNAQIPYAYPPLAFYLMALIKLASRQTLLNLFRIVPMLVSVSIVFAFYFFAEKIFHDRIKTALSVLFFAMLPRTFEWFIMGGGITRGLGFLFAILAIVCIWEMFGQNASWKNIIGAIIFSSGCVLSHPETSLFVIFIAGVLILYHRLNWANIKRGLIVAAGVIICSLPWIISVYSYHGLEPFLGAGGTGHGDWLEIKNFLTLNFGFENSKFLTIYSVFALIALFIKKDRLIYFLSASILIGYFLFPRSSPNLLTMFVSPLAAVGFYEILAFSGVKDKQNASFIKSLESSLKSKLILIFMVAYLLLGVFSFKYIMVRDEVILTDDLIRMYSWLDDNTNQDDNIMFYPAAGAERFWWNDFAAEWFPALTSNSNLTTVQGYEWIEGEFEQRVTDYLYLRTCPEIGPICIENWEAKNSINVEYLVLGQITVRQDFVENFLQNENYSIVYLGDDYLVMVKE